MFAISLDKNNYIKSFSDKFRAPGSILLDEMPNENDFEKLKCYQYIDGKFVFDIEKWNCVLQERAKDALNRTEEALLEKTQTEIDKLKAHLSASDYKVIKCYEYFSQNLAFPYDLADLHAERQKIRDQINDLENA